MLAALVRLAGGLVTEGNGMDGVVVLVALLAVLGTILVARRRERRLLAEFERERELIYDGLEGLYRRYADEVRTLREGVAEIERWVSEEPALAERWALARAERHATEFASDLETKVKTGHGPEQVTFQVDTLRTDHPARVQEQS